MFIGSDHSLEDRDAKIEWSIVMLHMTLVDHGTVDIDLQIADLVELQRESTGIDVNTILKKEGVLDFQVTQKSVRFSSYTMFKGAS